MSLIQDALKRQQEEMNKKAATTTPPVPGVKPIGKLETPVAPPPAIAQPRIPLRMMGQPGSASKPPEAEAKPTPATPPEAPPPLPASDPTRHAQGATAQPAVDPGPENRNEPESEKRSPVTLILASATLLLLVFAVVIYYWAWPRFSGKLLATVLPVSAPAVTTPAPTAPLHETAGATNTASAEDTKPSTGDTPAQSVTNMPQPIPAPEALATHSDLMEPLTVQEPAPPAVMAAVTPKPTPALPAIWPGIKVTGMVKLGGTAAALINGRVIAPGEEIEDVRLVSVNKDGAVLQYKGEERLLRVGETAR